MAKYLYAKVESGGKLVLKPADYEQDSMPTYTQLTSAQRKAVEAILKNPARALGATKKAEKAEVERKYGRAVGRVLAGKRHGFLRGNSLTPLFREAAGMQPKSSRNNGGTRRQSQRVEAEVAEVVLASMPASFDLDAYLQAL